MPDRTEILRAMFDASGRGLEIGASYNPLVTKASGANVETFDYTDRAGLIGKYASDKNVDTSKIEEVDYASYGRPIADVVPRRDYYDYIIASHVIEHVSNPIAFINDCGLLLKPDGRLILAVPDKRYCFDIGQQLSTSGQFLDAYCTNRTRPTPGAIFDAMAYDMLMDGKIGWSSEDHGDLTFANDLHYAASLFEYAKTAREYIDVHQWRFTPTSFRLIIADLRTIGILHLGEAMFHHSVRNEFYVALSARTSCPVERQDLVSQALEELWYRSPAPVSAA